MKFGKVLFFPIFSAPFFTPIYSEILVTHMLDLCHVVLIMLFCFLKIFFLFLLVRLNNFCWSIFMPTDFFSITSRLLLGLLSDFFFLNFRCYIFQLWNFHSFFYGFYFSAVWEGIGVRKHSVVLWLEPVPLDSELHQCFLGLCCVVFCFCLPP